VDALGAAYLGGGNLAALQRAGRVTERRRGCAVAGHAHRGSSDRRGRILTDTRLPATRMQGADPIRAWLLGPVRNARTGR
jgi:hypothetical protein